MFFPSGLFQYFCFVSCSSDLNEELTEHAYVNVLTRGDLSSLRWISSPLRHFASCDSNVVLCRVSFSSLNFRDVMLATGKLPPDAIPGTEWVLQSNSAFLLFLVYLSSNISRSYM